MSSEFCLWVHANEPNVLTYSVMTRPESKNGTEVVMYERYKDMEAFKGHGGSKEFKAMFKKLLPHIEPKKTKMAEWQEVEASFQGEGLVGEENKAKL
jgi:quinol monooxygenase YgiN